MNEVFHIQINSVLLKKLIDLSRLLTETAILYITPEGITISATDHFQSATLKLEMKNDAFEKYKATRFRLGLDLKRMKKFVDLVKPYEIVQMNYSKKQLEVSIEGLKTKMGKIDLLHETDLNIAILNASGYSILKVDKLKRALIVSDGIAENVVLGIDRNKFELRAEEKVDSVELRLKKEDLVELESEMYFEGIFLRKCLQDLFQCLPVESLVRIQFGDMTPLQIVYEFSNGGVHMTYYLMPVVEPL